MEPNNVTTDSSNVAMEPSNVASNPGNVAPSSSNVAPNHDNVAPSSSNAAADATPAAPSLGNLPQGSASERNKAFNLGIIVNCARRFWPLWLAYGIVLALLVVGPAYSAVNSLMVSHSYEVEPTLSALCGLWRIGAVEAVAIAFMASLISAIVHNDHLFSSRAATFVGSLPMRRTGTYMTFFAAGLLPLVVMPALAALVMLPLCVSSGGVFPASYVGLWLALMVMLTFIFYAMAQLSCHLAGSRPVAVLLYFVINFLAPCLETAADAIFTLLVYGLNTMSLHMEWAAPFVGLMVHGVFGNWDMDAITAPLLHWDVIGGYCVAALVAVALAGLLFNRRRLEAAGESIAFAQARPPLKYLAGISLALLFGLTYRLFCRNSISFGLILDVGGTVALGVALALGAFFGVLFAEMIIHRSARVLKGCWRGALALAAVCVALVAGAYFDVAGFQRYVPKASDVESVTVELEWNHGATLRSPEAIDAACALHHDIASWHDRGNQNDFYYDVTFVYNLANGSHLERHYVIHADYYNEHAHGAPDERSAALVQRTIDLLDTYEARKERYASLLSLDPLKLSIHLEYPYFSEEEHENGAYEDEDGNVSYGVYYDDFYLDAAEREELLTHALQHDLLEEQAGSLSNALSYRGSETALDAELYIENEQGDVFEVVTLDPVCAPETTAWFVEHHPELLEHLIDAENL